MIPLSLVEQHSVDKPTNKSAKKEGLVKYELHSLWHVITKRSFISTFYPQAGDNFSSVSWRKGHVCTNVLGCDRNSSSFIDIGFINTV